MPVPVPGPARPSLVAGIEVLALAGAALVVALKAADAAPRLVLALLELFP